MNPKNTDFKNAMLFLDRSKNVLGFFGIWMQENTGLLRVLYAISVLILEYSFLLFEIIYIVNVWGDLDAVSEASYLLFTHASVCYKSTAFMINNKSLMALLEMMECKPFEPQSKVHEKILSILSRRVKRLCLFFWVCALTTCTMWAAMPLFDEAGQRSFPFRIWMPVSPERSPAYQFGYLYQMVSIYTSAMLFMGVDSVAVSMIMFGCAQLEIIMDKIQKLHTVNMQHESSEGRIKILKHNNEIFIECIKQHQNVERLIQMVEDTYHANIFFQLGGSVAIICNIGLRISIATRNSLQFYSMLVYMVTMLSQLFMYCWCGNELTIRSEKLRECLYQCPWYEQDSKFKRSLWIAMERMKKPIIFKAGHYIPLSRPTFVVILRCSYSYFAVLNRVNNK